MQTRCQEQVQVVQHTQHDSALFLAALPLPVVGMNMQLELNKCSIAHLRREKVQRVICSGFAEAINKWRGNQKAGLAADNEN